MSASVILERCDALADLSETPHALTRTFLCPAMHAVHAALTLWMTTAGMTVRIDTIGNIIGHYPAEDENAPVLLLGSHLDTVPDAGKYDGVLGVLLALDAVEALRGARLPFAIDILGFSEEEGVRFGVPYLGSLGVIGELTDTHLALTDPQGVSVAAAARAFGLRPEIGTAYAPGKLLGYLEAHIEQGPILEKQGLPVGIATAIAGQSRLRLTFTGHAGHAGTTPMAQRRDAAAGAAEWMLAVEACGQATPGLVATVGLVEIAPGASNVVPGTARVSLDVRHADDEVWEAAVRQLIAAAETIAARRSLRVSLDSETHNAAVPMSAVLTRTLTAAVADTGVAVHHLVSGAGHDAAIMARAAPAALLFIRSPGGLSHHPDETVLPGDIEAAAQVLSCFLTRMADNPDE